MGQAGVRHVRTQHVFNVNHPSGRLGVLEIESRDPIDVVEDRRHLRTHPLDFVIGQTEAGKAGNMENFFALDHGS